MQYNFHSDSPEHTKKIAKKIARVLQAGDVLTLYGDLAAGKTTFTQGLSEYYHVEEAVTSPTFTLINEYHGDLKIFHMDCYRLKNPKEIMYLGFEEYLEKQGIVLIEWPERIQEYLPDKAISIHFEIDQNIENVRNIHLDSYRDLEL